MADWQKLKTIVADALDAPPERRPVMLEVACAGDAELMREASELIAAAGEADDTDALLTPDTDRFLGHDDAAARPLVGQTLGQYELIEPIGEGGMSRVYRARQRGTERDVAVKVLRRHTLAVDARRQFRREVLALGRVRHEHVAQVFEAGTHTLATGETLPFIAMELIEGRPITEHAAAASLDVDERAGLLAQVADAVHAAHQRAVIHRDLKPANVLVAADGTPKVLDFGIARVTDPDVRQTATATSGLMLGTLPYMSPEQLDGGDAELDVRTDVWSLGVLLHELLTGRPLAEVSGLPLPAALRKLEAATPDAKHPILTGDLGVIVGKACDRDPARRYASAAALGQDLRRWLTHQPIEARPPTRASVLKKFARRNRGGIAAAAVVSLSLLGGTLGSGFGYVNARAAQATAEEERDEAAQARADAEAARAEAEASRLEAVAARDEALLDRKRAEEALDDYAYEQDVRESTLAFFMEVLAYGASHPDAPLADAYDAADERVAALVARRPTAANAIRRMLADYFVANGQAERGLAVARQAVQDSGFIGSPGLLHDALVTLGANLARLERWEELAVVLDRADRLADWLAEDFRPVDRAWVSNLRSDRLAAAGDAEAALAQLDRSDEHLATALRLLPERERNLARYDDIRLATQGRRARRLMELGRDEDAAAIRAALAEPDPAAEAAGVGGSPSMDRLAAMIDEARALRDAGRWEEAAEALEKAIYFGADNIDYRYPDVVEGMLMMSPTMTALGRHEEALAWARQADLIMDMMRGTRSAGRVESQHVLGLALAAAGDAAGAAEAAELAASIAAERGDLPASLWVDVLIHHTALHDVDARTFRGKDLRRLHDRLVRDSAASDLIRRVADRLEELQAG